MKNKIRKKFATGYSSGHSKLTEEQLDFITNKNCECSHCSKSIFEMDDYPVLEEEDDLLLCEDCYDEEYRDICPICENSYEIRFNEKDHIVVTKELAKEQGIEAGIYKVENGFFLACQVFGFQSFFEDKLKLVSQIDIDEYLNSDNNREDSNIDSGFICDSCVEDLVRKNGYFNSKYYPAVLSKNASEYFENYPKEELKQMRHSVVHKRITTRGILQQANKSKV